MISSSKVFDVALDVVRYCAIRSTIKVPNVRSLYSEMLFGKIISRNLHFAVFLFVPSGKARLNGAGHKGYVKTI